MVVLDAGRSEHRLVAARLARLAALLRVIGAVESGQQLHELFEDALLPQRQFPHQPAYLRLLGVRRRKRRRRRGLPGGLRLNVQF
jgi:hypothetical protein